MKCVYIKSDKQRCGANSILGESHCFSHSSNMIDAKRDAVIRGGQSPRHSTRILEPIEIENMNGVVRLLCQTINEVRSGKSDLRVANCVGYLAGHLIKAYEIADLELRVIEMEAQLKQKN